MREAKNRIMARVKVGDREPSQIARKKSPRLRRNGGGRRLILGKTGGVAFEERTTDANSSFRAESYNAIILRSTNRCESHHGFAGCIMPTDLQVGESHFAGLELTFNLTFLEVHT